MPVIVWGGITNRWSSRKPSGTCCQTVSCTTHRHKYRLLGNLSMDQWRNSMLSNLVSHNGLECTSSTLNTSAKASSNPNWYSCINSSSEAPSCTASCFTLVTPLLEMPQGTCFGKAASLLWHSLQPHDMWPISGPWLQLRQPFHCSPTPPCSLWSSPLWGRKHCLRLCKLIVTGQTWTAACDKKFLQGTGNQWSKRF